MLKDKYLNGVPSDARAAKNRSFNQKLLTDDNLNRIKGLNEFATDGGIDLWKVSSSLKE